MQEIYQVEGIINKGFVGQISYTICLDHPLTSLDIHVQFDKQRFTESSPALREETKALCLAKYQMHLTDEEADQIILGDMKTEIHTLANLNDTFIGCVHKQLTDRHMLYTPGEASEGCIPQDVLEGVLKVTLLVFNCIQDQTRYQLSVSGAKLSRNSTPEERSVSLHV